MTKIRGHVQNFELKEPVGLQDGGHVIIRCSCCDAQLVDIWIQMPQTKQKWRGRATCPYCGDKSYITEWNGGFAPAGINLPNPNDPENDIPKTAILDYGEEKDAEGRDVVLFLMKKVGDEQPVR
jgi:hypothetical protein